jgi:TonB family protein
VRSLHQPHPLLPWGLSALLHGALAVGLFLVPAEAKRQSDLPDIEISRKPPPEPKPKPDEKPQVAPPKDAPVKVASVSRLPRLRPPPSEPEPKPAPKTTEPVPDDTGPKTFGLPKMSGTTTAAPGSGVQVPEGDSLAVSPKITKKGKEPPAKPRPFKSSYSKGEEAPVAVLTTQPKVTKKVTAEYPEKMKELGIEGRVILELTIDGSGQVVAVRVVKSLRKELDETAAAAARQMAFAPATVNGTPVKVKIPYTFTFVLD